jgi:hypothetical protein
LVIVGVLVASQVMFLLPAAADTFTSSGSVNVTAQVGLVNPEPAQLVTGNGGGSFMADIPSRPAVPKPPLGYNPLVSILPDAPNVISRPSASNPQQFEWVFPIQYPEFSGKTNVQNGIVFISITNASSVTALKTARVTGTTIVRSSTTTDNTGVWRWRAADPLPVGRYVFTVMVSDPANSEGFVGSSLDFVVELPVGQTPAVPTPVVGNTFTRVQAALADVYVNIPQSNRAHVPGDPIQAQVRLINFGTQIQPVDVTVVYDITDAQRKIVLTNEETVSVGRELALVKTFYTDKTLPTGLYTLDVRVPTNSLTLSASDNFNIVPIQPVAVAGTTVFGSLSEDQLFVYAAFAAVVILFLTLILFEYRHIHLLTITLRSEGRR